MTETAVKSAERRLLPPLNPDEQTILARALIKDAMQMFRGKAGATLAITSGDGSFINARSKPLEVIAFRMRQYNACPALFRFFLWRHDGDLFDRLRVYYVVTFPECMEA